MPGTVRDLQDTVRDLQAPAILRFIVTLVR